MLGSGFLWKFFVALSFSDLELSRTYGFTAAPPFAWKDNMDKRVRYANISPNQKSPLLSLKSLHSNDEIEPLDHERENKINIKLDRASTLLSQTDNILESNSNILMKSDIEKVQKSIEESTKRGSSRRLFMASALISTSAAIAINDPSSSIKVATPFTPLSANAATIDELQYQKSPVNKRSGITVFSAEKEGYNVRFVTYLSRFLLYFDDACQKWWYSRAADLPRKATADEVDMIRLNQFAAFSASVEVGLQEYVGENGPERLLDSLLTRYCPDSSSPDIIDSETSPDKAAKQKGEIKEAKRQIALLFGLLEDRQPVEKLTKLLAAIDNAEIMFVSLVSQGGGYAPGYGPPEVIFPPPVAGNDYRQAKGRAVLQPNGKLLRIDIKNRGFGYSKPPLVTISAPAGKNMSSISTTNYTQATASAVLFRDGVNKGRIERIQLIDPGCGYVANETISIKVSPPDLLSKNGGVTATAHAILEYEIGSIQIIDGGSGYAAEKTLPIFIEPPPITARINANDPLLYKMFTKDYSKNDPAKVRAEKLQAMRLNAEKVANNDGLGGGGGCIGRACYDRPALATAYPRAEKDSYSSFNSQDDFDKFISIETALRSSTSTSSATDDSKEKRRIISGTVGGYGYDKPPNPFFGKSSSTQLLSLLPAGIGLEYNTNIKRYQLAAGMGFEEISENWMQGSSSKPIFTEFGPRGRSPIERQRDLDLETVLRFVFSGAICSSGVHLALTPIDVVKTKVQTDPVKYNGVIQSFNTVIKDEGGISTLFTGWVPTFLGWFVWGGISYSCTEAFRRYFTESVSAADAITLEVPIVILSAALAAFLGSFFITPFEAVRIRSVAQPDYADNILGVLNRMVEEEGPWSLFAAVGAVLLKEIPFGCAKFAIFDITSNYLYEQFPAAREDIKLSLTISLFSGISGGIIAAIASNPADATISEMKKKKTDMGPVEAANVLLEREGIPALFKGLGLRMFFYSLVVSLQFLVYDYIRFALGIGSDDLKLYLNVLGGALSESGGPI